MPSYAGRRYARILAEQPTETNQQLMFSLAGIRRMLPACYPLGMDPDYEPTPDRMLGRQAHDTGRSVEELAYDALTAEDSCGMLLFPVFNYVDGNHDVLYEQMLDPAAVLGLDDGGAHCATICDASIPSYVLTHWVRDRTRGPRLQLEDAVRRLTSQPAELYGFTDRGRIAPGLRADLNVLDLEALHLQAPVAVRDLPAGGTRILQAVDGYRATIVAGEVTRLNGTDTGARPGRLLRG